MPLFIFVFNEIITKQFKNRILCIDDRFCRMNIFLYLSTDETCRLLCRVFVNDIFVYETRTRSAHCTFSTQNILFGNLIPKSLFIFIFFFSPELHVSYCFERDIGNWLWKRRSSMVRREIWIHRKEIGCQGRETGGITSNDVALPLPSQSFSMLSAAFI